jgi:hypothetical protein
MNAQQMIEKIQKTLNQNEELTINVTYARGRALVKTYNVTANDVKYVGHSWSGRGNVRNVYAQRVLNA